MGLSDCIVEPLLAVSELDRARRFYERQLGLVPGDVEEGEADGVPRRRAGRVQSGTRTCASR